MPWVIGVDEAGYGPNLGPLVQAAVAARLPDADPAGWDTLRPVVRRATEKADGRLLVDDSKQVHKGANGLAKLERGVWAALGPFGPTIGDVCGRVVLAGCRDDLTGEAWYVPANPAPFTGAPLVPQPRRRSRDAESAERSAGTNDDAVAAPALPSADSGSRLREMVGTCFAVASVVPAPRFNRVVDESDSKATVLTRGLIELLHASAAALPADGDPLAVVCDKQGGRNVYGSLVQSAFPDGWVTAGCEGAAESRYRVDGLDRPVTVVFRPKADGASVAVALASMLAKYLREVCMLQFNAYWATHVPGLNPTAGYPVDAKRFYAAIGPAMERLGLTADQVWRKR